MLNRTNFTIIEQVFPLVFLGFPIRCILSMSGNVISKSNFSFRVLIITSSVVSSFSSSIPCTRRQFHLEYCSYWSWSFLRFSILVNRLSTSDLRSSIILSFFALSSSYSLNLFEFTFNLSGCLWILSDQVTAFRL